MSPRDLATPLLLASLLCLGTALPAGAQKTASPEPGTAPTDTAPGRADAASGAAETAADPFLARYPHGSPEMARLEPLVGDWTIVTRAKQPDGSFVEGKARWRFWYVMDGYALMDEWRAPGPDGVEGVGINLRHWDSEAGHYVARWLSTRLADWNGYTAGFEGDRFVMRGRSTAPSGNEGDARITFYDIRPDSFRWKLDWSVDGGETWIPEVFLIEATRVH
jgi:hypothetical protein